MDLGIFSKRFLTLALIVTGLTACDYDLVKYAAKQGTRQGSLILKAESTDKLLKSTQTPSHITSYLHLNNELLDYAENQLGMKTGKSYRQLVVINRNWVTQLVVAAKKESLEPHYFSFPIVGKVPYKGFFDKADADKEAEKLKAEGLDVYQRSAPAFSSLGWFADPLYTNMFHSPAYFADLILHELVHLNFYFKGEADFNEAFATWFAMKVTPLFIKQSKTIADREKALGDLEKFVEDDRAYLSFVKKAVSLAKQGYKNNESRETIFSKLSELARETKGLSKRFKTIEWNNAVLLSLSTYYEKVEAIDSFATENKLTPTAFLKKCVEEGAPLLKQIFKEPKPTEL